MKTGSQIKKMLGMILRKIDDDATDLLRQQERKISAHRFHDRVQTFIGTTPFAPLNDVIFDNSRPSWDEIWMEMAQTLSRRSVDPRTKVGCVVVSGDNTKILALGYNGDHVGGLNAVDSTEPGQSNFIHAEENAIIKLDYGLHHKKVLYVTVSPCYMCAKRIINAKIDEVVYGID